MTEEKKKTKTVKKKEEKTEVKHSEHKTEPKPEHKTEHKVDPKPEAKPEHKVEHKDASHSEHKTEPKPEHKETPHVKHESTHEVKAEEKPKAETPKKKRKKPVSKKGTVAIGKGKRKASIARAIIKAGTGAIRVNSLSVSSFNNKYIGEIVCEPLRFLGPEATKIDINVIVNGGGMMGRAQAARTAIANALVHYFDDKEMEAKMIEFDRSLLVSDARRVESKKFKGPKARARFQKSYR